MITNIKKTEKDPEISKPECPICGKKLTQIGVKNEGKAQGLTTRCKNCGNYLEINIE